MATARCAAPLVPVSWGELLDKIVILEIKCERLLTSAARANARHELDGLVPTLALLAPIPEALGQLRSDLAAVNRRLWDIENAIRAKDAAADFGEEFIALARSIYRENDERGRIKHEINRLLRSPITEQKQYATY